MRIGSTGWLLLAATTAFLLAACGSDATGPAGALDAESVRAQAERVAEIGQLPAVRGLIGTALGDTPPIFGRRTATALLGRAAVARATGAGAWLASNLLGKTFVRVNGAWVADSTRTGAPANGVRVVLYDRESDGTLGTTEVGLLEAVDSSAADGSTIIGIVRLFDAGGAPVGGWRFVNDPLDPALPTSVTGSLGPADRALALADTTDFPGSSGTALDGIRTVQRVAAPFVDAGVQRVAEAGSTVFGAPLRITEIVTSHGHTVRSETTVATADSTDVEISIDDRLVARIPPGSDSLLAPDGGAAAPSLVDLIHAVDALAAAAPSASALHASVGFLLQQIESPTP
ncbi:MAG TPA: hypothetical protein VF041_05980 [Gemmatimonadaceae bacterium]